MKILTAGKYYGVKKSEIGFNGVILSEYDYLSPRTDWHFHENPYFMYILHGNLLDINKKYKTICPTGSLIFHNWQEAHYNTKETTQARGFHVEFERQWFKEKRLDIDLWEGSQFISHPKAHHILGKLYFEFRCQDLYSELSMELLLLQLCENTQSTQVLPKKEPPWVNSLKRIIHEDIENLNLKFLSEQLGVHPVHISRAIPKYLASSLGDYIRQQKIRKSLGYLLNSEHSLTEIAYLCGFSDHSHFTRTFKAYLGTIPSIFRRRVL